MSKFYVAYGSNLNIKQMRTRCPGAKVIGTSVINDYELLFKGSKTGAYLTIEEKRGEKVPVAIWQIDEEDELSLDYYEGYPTFYYKKDMTLDVKIIENGKTEKLDTFVYIMHEDRIISKPTLYYVNACKEGYDSFGFDTIHLAKAYKKSLKGENVQCHKTIF